MPDPPVARSRRCRSRRSRSRPRPGRWRKSTRRRRRCRRGGRAPRKRMVGSLRRMGADRTRSRAPGGEESLEGDAARGQGVQRVRRSAYLPRTKAPSTGAMLAAMSSPHSPPSIPSRGVRSGARRKKLGMSLSGMRRASRSSWKRSRSTRTRRTPARAVCITGSARDRSTPRQGSQRRRGRHHHHRLARGRCLGSLEGPLVGERGRGAADLDHRDPPLALDDGARRNDGESGAAGEAGERGHGAAGGSAGLRLGAVGGARRSPAGSARRACVHAR